MLMKMKIKEIKIKKISKELYNGKVYNIEVADNHNYFADGF